MQVFIVSALLWGVSLLALARLWQTERVRGRIVTLLMLLMAGVLMLRPHEDIFGGEDPGSYINSGITYANQQAFFHTDPILAQVQPELRPMFYYGHSGFGATKDACLWVCNEQQARLGPRFQPAYPLLMSGLVGLTRSPWAALYVAPIFAIFTALALRALFTLFYPGRCAGWAVFWLFLLNPLVAWHGRCPRPEIVAAFLLFAGISLLLRAARGAPRQHRLDVWLGGLCCMLAPFVHVTAWFVVLPVFAVLLLAGGVGRRDLVAACLWVPAALWVLDYQARHITDYYGLGRMLRQGLANPLWWVAVLAGIPLLWWCGRRLVKWRWPLWLFRGFAWGVGLVGAAAFVWCFFCRDAEGSLPFLRRPVEHLFYLTDFRAVVNMFSTWLALLGLLGWLAWCVAPGRGRVMRPLLAAMLMPAICLAGRINDFMMTRYLLVALVPMLTLGLAALAYFIADRVEGCWRNRGARIPLAARRSVVLVLMALLMAGVGLRGRTHLVRVTEYRGLARFLAQFARPVAGCEGALLAEYSRLAAPFDHFFNLPVLAVDNERRDDYTEIEREWERLMRQFDDVPVFFITPFRSAVSDRFVFTPLRQDVFNYQSLRQAGRNLPVEV
ncbi:MAG: hypothetical protein LC725_12630, partial [Lentisphaerae bacterium]|nr:hypothetical protein [Lentisphaerota bacterium]